MNRTAFVTSEHKQDYPILIVDKDGKIGEALSLELNNESLVVFVSKNPPENLENVIHVPFSKKIPTIPDNTYSHIFVVDENGQITKDVMDQFIEKAKKDDSDFNLIIGLNAVTELLISEITSEYSKAKVIITGEIFQSNAIYNSSTQINKFILQAKTKGKLMIPGDGTESLSSIAFEDVISGILQATFGIDEKDKTVYLFPKHKVTLLSLANIFRKINPDLRIDFTKDTSAQQSNFVPPITGKYYLGEEYGLENKIKKIDFSSISINADEEEAPKQQVHQRATQRVFSYKLLLLSIIFLILLPAMTTLLLALIGAGSLYAVKNSLETGQLASSKILISVANSSFNLANGTGIIFRDEAGILGQESKVDELINGINSGQEISAAALSLLDVSDKLKNVLAGRSTNPTADFNSASIELKSALYVYNKEEQKGIIPQSVITKLSDSIKIASATIDFWPDIFGFNGKRTYLILFQNNMELRPGGGFIGSYALLTLNKGKITNFNIYDVYDADGQLKGHIEPPFPIRRYLPQIHWYLRDSNFNVDFSKGAVSSAVFLNDETGQRVDGVVGVDLSFVKNILSLVGSVRVNDYNQTVSTNNFFQVTQSQVEKDFFPGSTQKKDFLSSFYQALQLKLSAENNIPYAAMLQTLSKSIYDKHVLFAFSNGDEQAAFAINGWSSALVDERPVDNSTVNDFMGINEANLGEDKVNYYIQRNLTQNINIKADGTVNESLNVTFKNQAQTNSLIGGNYKNYLRVILPLNANLSSIQIDGKDQKIVPAIMDPAVYEKQGFIAPSGLEAEKEVQGQNTIYGFLVNVKPQETLTVVINYQLAQKISLSQPEISYDLKVFKQPGVDYYPYNFSLNFPSNFKELNSSSDVVTQGNVAQLSTQITRDREVSVGLAAK